MRGQSPNAEGLPHTFTYAIFTHTLSLYKWWCISISPIAPYHRSRLGHLWSKLSSLLCAERGRRSGFCVCWHDVHFGFNLIFHHFWNLYSLFSHFISKHFCEDSVFSCIGFLSYKRTYNAPLCKM